MSKAVSGLINEVVTEEWMTIGRVLSLVHESMIDSGDAKYGEDESRFREEYVAVVCGRLIERCVLDCTTFTDWNGNETFLVRRRER